MSTPALAGLGKYWAQRPVRERRLVLGACVLLLALGVWQLVLGPAWSVWRSAPERQRQLDAQTRQMLDLQAQARQLQATPLLSHDAAMKQLQASAQQLLGPGTQLQLQGDLLRVTLQAAPAEGLAQWLAMARSQSQARTVQADLQRQEGELAETLWRGQIQLRMP